MQEVKQMAPEQEEIRVIMICFTKIQSNSLIPLRLKALEHLNWGTDLLLLLSCWDLACFGKPLQSFPIGLDWRSLLWMELKGIKWNMGFRRCNESSDLIYLEYKGVGIVILQQCDFVFDGRPFTLSNIIYYSQFEINWSMEMEDRLWKNMFRQSREDDMQVQHLDKIMSLNAGWKNRFLHLNHFMHSSWANLLDMKGYSTLLSRISTSHGVRRIWKSENESFAKYLFGKGKSKEWRGHALIGNSLVVCLLDKKNQ